MNSLRPGLNKARAAADFEEASETADAFASIASMLGLVKDFADRALKSDVNGGRFQDEGAGVVDAISDAIGEALQAESKLLE